MRDRESPGSSDSRVAQAVSAFYEHHPYPPPVDDLERYRDDRSILVAGCGTSQAAKHAVRWPRARVTGIDFSATSVRCTEALKPKYKLDNLDLHQLAVERAGELGTQL